MRETEIPEGAEAIFADSAGDALAQLAVNITGHDCAECAIIELARAIGIVVEMAGDSLNLSKEEILLGLKSILENEEKEIVRAHVH